MRVCVAGLLVVASCVDAPVSVRLPSLSEQTQTLIVVGVVDGNDRIGAYGGVVARAEGGATRAAVAIPVEGSLIALAYAESAEMLSVSIGPIERGSAAEARDCALAFPLETWTRPPDSGEWQLRESPPSLVLELLLGDKDCVCPSWTIDYAPIDPIAASPQPATVRVRAAFRLPDGQLLLGTTGDSAPNALFLWDPNAEAARDREPDPLRPVIGCPQGGAHGGVEGSTDHFWLAEDGGRVLLVRLDAGADSCEIVIDTTNPNADMVHRDKPWWVVSGLEAPDEDIYVLTTTGSLDRYTVAEGWTRIDTVSLNPAALAEFLEDPNDSGSKTGGLVWTSGGLLVANAGADEVLVIDGDASERFSLSLGPEAEALGVWSVDGLGVMIFGADGRGWRFDETARSWKRSFDLDIAPRAVRAYGRGFVAVSELGEFQQVVRDRLCEPFSIQSVDAPPKTILLDPDTDGLLLPDTAKVADTLLIVRMTPSMRPR